MTVSVAQAPAVDEFVRGLVPEWAIPLFVAVTFLGNVGFLLGLLTVDYWVWDRERGAHALAVAVAGAALVTGLKALFAAPRPPASVNVIPITGYSFPSGHALASTVVYGVLAVDLDAGSRRSRALVAGILIAAIALSRVVLGVHFTRDVVAGVVIGGVFLALAFVLTGRDPGRAFLLAVVVALAALVASGASHDGVAVAGASLGAALAWHAIEDVPRVERRSRRAALFGVVLPGLAVLGYVAVEVASALPTVFVLNAVLLGGVLTAPSLVVRADRSVELSPG